MPPKGRKKPIFSRTQGPKPITEDASSSHYSNDPAIKSPVPLRSLSLPDTLPPVRRPFDLEGLLGGRTDVKAYRATLAGIPPNEGNTERPAHIKWPPSPSSTESESEPESEAPLPPIILPQASPLQACSSQPTPTEPLPCKPSPSEPSPSEPSPSKPSPSEPSPPEPSPPEPALPPAPVHRSKSTNDSIHPHTRRTRHNVPTITRTAWQESQGKRAEDGKYPVKYIDDDINQPLDYDLMEEIMRREGLRGLGKAPCANCWRIHWHDFYKGCLLTQHFYDWDDASMCRPDSEKW